MAAEAPKAAPERRRADSPEARKAGGRPVWDVLADWLRDQREVTARPLNTPRIVGMADNPGMEAGPG